MPYAFNPFTANFDYYQKSAVGADTTPGGSSSALLLEDGFGLLLEDGSSFLLFES